MEGNEDHFVKGLMLLLTNNLAQCEDHFSKLTERLDIPISDRVRASYGHSLVSVVRALISFEDEEKSLALARLLATQKMAGSTSSWFSGRESGANLMKNLDLELISADAGLFIALLQFTQESAMGFMRGALALRKSYKIYQKAAHIPEVNRVENSNNIKKKSRWTSTEALIVDNEAYFDTSPIEEDCLGSIHGDGYGPLVTQDATLAQRILASSQLGMGLFNLVFSLIPPRFTSMIGTAMGFESNADRKVGLRLLRECASPGTSRSPLAALVLLIFHSAMLILARGLSDDTDTNEAF